MSDRPEVVQALREMLAASGVMHAYIADEIPADRQPSAALLATEARDLIVDLAAALGVEPQDLMGDSD